MTVLVYGASRWRTPAFMVVLIRALGDIVCLFWRSGFLQDREVFSLTDGRVIVQQLWPFVLATTAAVLRSSLAVAGRLGRSRRIRTLPERERCEHEKDRLL